jgi:DNA-binding NarL/FixJ family response regulator
MNSAIPCKKSALIVACHVMLGELLAQHILHQMPDVSVVVARNVKEARELFSMRGFDVVMLEVQLPGCSGISVAQEIKQRHPATKCLMLSDDSNGMWVERALKVNADGFITKFCDCSKVMEALKLLLNGERYFSPEVTTSFAAYLISQHKDEIHRILTAREFEVFMQIGSGKTVKVISHELKLSPRTVSVHKHNIRKKTGIDSSARIARYCLEHGLLKGAA